MSDPLVIRARWLFDATSPLRVQEHMAVTIRDGLIESVFVDPDRSIERPGYKILEYPDGFLLPGLVDTHLHLSYGVGERLLGPRSYTHVNEVDSDALMLLRSVRNAFTHLLAGVTTMRDCGARNRVALDLSQGLEAGLFGLAPTVLVCGRSITPTGGHFHFCGEEADGDVEVRRSVRRLAKEGAHFIKVMASGGSTHRSDPTKPSYTIGELSAITDEARRRGLLTTAHCIAVEAIRDAVTAGFDCLEHVDFMWPNGECRYDSELGELIAESGCWVSPTPQVAYTFIGLLENMGKASRLSPRDRERKERLERKLDAKLGIIERLRGLGVRLTLGSDELVRFGDVVSGLKLLVDAGMSTLEALTCATINGARAIGVDSTVGSVQAGKIADLVVARGNVAEDISRMQLVSQVFKRGVPVPTQIASVFSD